MENQSRFDLNAAIESWRQELLAQPGLTPGDLRELETHLHDTIAELRGCSLDDRESFLLARRRTGPPRQIAGEFAKADPAMVWRERVFWMAVAMLAVGGWWLEISRIVESLIYELIYKFIPLPAWTNSPVSQATASISHLVFAYLPLVCCAVLLLQGRMIHKMSWISSVFNSRSRFILVAVTAVCAIHFLFYATLLQMMRHYNHRANLPFLFIQLLLSSALDFIPIGLIAWLMPAQPRKTPKPA